MPGMGYEFHRIRLTPFIPLHRILINGAPAARGPIALLIVQKNRNRDIRNDAECLLHFGILFISASGQEARCVQYHFEQCSVTPLPHTSNGF